MKKATSVIIALAIGHILMAQTYIGTANLEKIARWDEVMGDWGDADWIASKGTVKYMVQLTSRKIVIAGRQYDLEESAEVDSKDESIRHLTWRNSTDDHGNKCTILLSIGKQLAFISVLYLRKTGSVGYYWQGEAKNFKKIED